MTWESYRARLLASNEPLRDPERMMRIRSRAFLAQIEKAYRQAVEDFVADGRRCGGSSDVPEFLSDLFGGFGKGAK
jgi:hypothetical protein